MRLDVHCCVVFPCASLRLLTTLKMVYSFCGWSVWLLTISKMVRDFCARPRYSSSCFSHRLAICSLLVARLFNIVNLVEENCIHFT